MKKCNPTPEKSYHLQQTVCGSLQVTEMIPLRSEEEEQEYRQNVTEQCLQLLREHNRRWE